MPLTFPTQNTLQQLFVARSPWSQQQLPPLEATQSSYRARKDLFPAWSAADDVKSKASQLSNEAQKEFQKASSLAQAKAGKIELYSAKYYAACTLGGLLACVGAL